MLSWMIPLRAWGCRRSLVSVLVGRGLSAGARSASRQGEAALASPSSPRVCRGSLVSLVLLPSLHLAGFNPLPWSLRESPPGKDGSASAWPPKVARPLLSVEGPVDGAQGCQRCLGMSRVTVSPCPAWVPVLLSRPGGQRLQLGIHSVACGLVAAAGALCRDGALGGCTGEENPCSREDV